MKWKAKVVYNAVTLLFTISQKPWEPESKAVGGHGVSGAGVPESYTQRRDERLTVTLRFYESQLNAVMTWLAWAQDNAGTAFDWYAEATDVSPVSVYLDAPLIPEPIKPTRVPTFLKVYEIPVTLRTTNGARFTRAYF